MFHMQALKAPAGMAWEGSSDCTLDRFEPQQRLRLSTPVSDLSIVHPEAVVASSQDLGWRNVRVLQVRNADTEMSIPALENHCLIVQLERSVHVRATIGRHDFDSVLTWGDIATIPAGMPSLWRWQDDGSHDAFHIYLHPEFVRKIAETHDLNSQDIAIRAQLGVQDGQLSHLAMSLLYELKQENIMGSLFADSAASLLAMQLARLYSRLKAVRILRGGMAPQKLRRAISFMNDNLARPQELALASVAAQAGMSRFHFSRAFKQSMGLSPINYILQQRIERAKNLLAETDLPIAEIAFRAGFSGQSHFTTCFRKSVGVTPRSFRRGL